MMNAQSAVFIAVLGLCLLSFSECFDMRNNVGLHLQEGYDISMSGQLSGRVVADGFPISRSNEHNLNPTVYFDVRDVYVFGEVYKTNQSEHFLDQLTTPYERFHTEFFIDAKEMIALAGDMGIRMDFWPTMRSVSDGIAPHLLPEKWSLLLVFGPSGEYGPFLRSYALKARFSTKQMNATKIWGTSLGIQPAWHDLTGCKCSWNNGVSTRLARFPELHLYFEKLCARVHVHSRDYCPILPAVDPMMGNEGFEHSHRHAHSPATLQYLALYIIQMLLVVLVVIVIVVLIARMRKQRKERLRTMPRVSYVYANPPQLQIIPTTTADPPKDVSQMVFH